MYRHAPFPDRAIGARLEIVKRGGNLVRFQLLKEAHRIDGSFGSDRTFFLCVLRELCERSFYLAKSAEIAEDESTHGIEGAADLMG